MAFKITSTTGFVDSGGKIDFLTPSIVADTGAKLGAYSRPTSVLWRRNNAFNTADLEIINARIADSNRLGSGIDVGEKVKVKIGGDVIFAGYIVQQSMRASGGTDTSKNEQVILKCVDYRYDLFREVIFGQIGIQADGSTGAEASEGGAYGGGVTWFSGLRCVFNDRTFAKNIENIVPKTTIGGQIGNGRKVPGGAFSSLGGDKPLKIFDGNYHVLNKEDGDPAAIYGSGRVNAWSAWDMLTYILAFCYDPPYAKASIFDTVQPILVSKARIILGDKNGMDAVFPVNVDVQGLTALDAITKVCASAGYNWWLEPDTVGGASKIVVWRTGSPGPESKSFYMGSGGSGMPRGLYRTLAAPLDFPLITTKWNVDDISIDIDYTGVVGTLIGTTQNIRVQNVFFLVKGWANSVLFKFVTKVAIDAAKVKDLPTSGSNREPRVHTFKEGKDEAGKTVRYFVHKLGTNVQVSLDRDGSSEGLLDGDSLASMFRRWITDDTGIVKTSDDKERAPYKFHVAGLIEENGGLYMVKPRPFLSALLQGSKSGDKRPPKIGFPKFEPEQSDIVFVDADDDPKVIKNKRGEINRDRAKLDAADKKFYPFGTKKGQIRILRDTSGCFIEGGFLDLQNVTVDPKANTITFFNPAALAAIEHDQAKIALASCLSTIGDIKPARRWIDGKRFVVERVYATQYNDTPSPERIAEGDAAKDATDEKAEDIITSIDETAKLEAEMEASCDYYKAPKISMRVKIPQITTAYKLSHKIVGVDGAGGATRLALEGASNTVVGVQFDLLQMNTTVSVESERLNQRGLKVLADRSE